MLICMLIWTKIHDYHSKARAKTIFFAYFCFLLRHFGTSIRKIIYLCTRIVQLNKPEE
jgi:hypothetical protein